MPTETVHLLKLRPLKFVIYTWLYVSYTITKQEMVMLREIERERVVSKLER